MRHTVDYLYSLYDALLSINVPNDKARAVVDAMERDMATTIATKLDLQLLKSDLNGLRQELKADVNLLRQEMTSAIALLATKAELQWVGTGLRQDVALVRKDMEILSTRIDMVSTTMTVRLSSMLMLGLGLLFAALKLT